MVIETALLTIGFVAGVGTTVVGFLFLSMGREHPNGDEAERKLAISRPVIIAVSQTLEQSSESITYH